MPNPAMRALAPLLLALVAACVPVGSGEGGPAPLATDAISVTALPPAGAAAPAAPAVAEVTAAETGTAAPAPDKAVAPADAPAPEVDTPAAAPAEAAPPPPPLSPEALACQRRGGSYLAAREGGARTCVRPTGEGTKRCTRESDCKGQCLARSGTCAPVTPLLGCNDILQANGQRATLCVD